MGALNLLRMVTTFRINVNLTANEISYAYSYDYSYWYFNSLQFQQVKYFVFETLLGRVVFLSSNLNRNFTSLVKLVSSLLYFRLSWSKLYVSFKGNWAPGECILLHLIYHRTMSGNFLSIGKTIMLGFDNSFSRTSISISWHILYYALSTFANFHSLYLLEKWKIYAQLWHILRISLDI